MSDANLAVDFIYQNAPLFSQAKSERVRLEEYRKSKKALLMCQSEAKTAAEREQYAYSHPEYIELLTDLATAVAKEELLRLQIDAAKLRVEIYRTESANNRYLDKVTQ